MVEVQDSKDEELKETQEDTSDFADKYIHRRGLDTSKPFTSRLTKLGYSDNSDQLLARVRTPDTDFIIHIDGNGSTEENLAKFLSEAPRELISKEEGLRTERKFDSWISSDLRRFGFNKDSKKYDVVVEDLPKIEDQSQQLIEESYPYYIYEKQSGDKPGVKRNIKEVEGVSDEKFRLRSDLTLDEELEWVFSVPYQVDIDKHPLATLIEEQANGDPRNLEDNTQVHIVKREDLIGRVHPAGFDKTKQWALVSKEEYKSWNPRNYNRFSSVSNSSRSQGLKKLYLRYLLFLILLMSIIMVTITSQFVL